MKRNRNATVKAFEDAFASYLAAHGVTPARQLPWHEETPEFEIETAAGKYTFHPEPQIGDAKHGIKPLNFVGVFGRFDNPGEARKIADCNPYSGKWNFDGNGHVATEEEAAALARNIARRILKLRISTP